MLKFLVIYLLFQKSCPKLFFAASLIQLLMFLCTWLRVVLGNGGKRRHLTRERDFRDTVYAILALGIFIFTSSPPLPSPLSWRRRAAVRCRSRAEIHADSVGEHTPSSLQPILTVRRWRQRPWSRAGSHRTSPGRPGHSWTPSVFHRWRICPAL